MAQSKQELQWQAQDDARTLAKYQEIIQDKTRMGRAIKEAKKQSVDLQKRAAAMQRASRTGNKK